MKYVDGFVAAVPAENKEAYIAHVKESAPLFKELGVTRMVECWGDDVPEGQVTDFRRAVQAKEGEVIVFSWLEYPSKEVRDAANQKMMTDPRMQAMGAKMPFDAKRMIFGGFLPSWTPEGRASALRRKSRRHGRQAMAPPRSAHTALLRGGAHRSLTTGDAVMTAARPAAPLHARARGRRIEDHAEARAEGRSTTGGLIRTADAVGGLRAHHGAPCRDAPVAAGDLAVDGGADGGRDGGDVTVRREHRRRRIPAGDPAVARAARPPRSVRALDLVEPHQAVVAARRLPRGGHAARPRRLAPAALGSPLGHPADQRGRIPASDDVRALRADSERRLGAARDPERRETRVAARALPRAAGDAIGRRDRGRGPRLRAGGGRQRHSQEDDGERRETERSEAGAHAVSAATGLDRRFLGLFKES